MGVNEQLAERARKAAEAQSAGTGFQLREKLMFGGLAFMLGDKMFVGVIGEELMVRVGPAAYEESLARPHTREMDFTGKPMRGYVFVEAAGCAKQADVTRWVARAAANVATLAGSPPPPTHAARRG
jgi:TfoX/Sxy family transcriptional regulator of competence genes